MSDQDQPRDALLAEESDLLSYIVDLRLLSVNRPFFGAASTLAVAQQHLDLVQMKIAAIDRQDVIEPGLSA